jgi:drug/metabolite transporter (DMT)-like permease
MRTKVGEGSMPKSMLKYVFCVIYIIFTVSGLTMVKMGSSPDMKSSFVIPGIDMTISALTLAGIFCYGVSFCIYMGIISKFDIGIIVPIMNGIVNILIIIVAYFVLKEKLTVNMIVGALVIVAGIFIMNINKA